MKNQDFCWFSSIKFAQKFYWEVYRENLKENKLEIFIGSGLFNFILAATC